MHSLYLFTGAVGPGCPICFPLTFVNRPASLSFYHFFLFFRSHSCSLPPSALLFVSGYAVVRHWHEGLPTISYRKALQKDRGGHEKLYLASAEVGSKGKREAFIQVGTRKAFHFLPFSLPLSQNQCSKIPQSQILLHAINYSTCLFCTTTPVYKDCLANCKCLRAHWAPITSQPHTLITQWFSSILPSPTTSTPLTSAPTGHLSGWHRGSRSGRKPWAMSVNRVERDERCQSRLVELVIWAEVWLRAQHLAASPSRCAATLRRLWKYMSKNHSAEHQDSWWTESTSIVSQCNLLYEKKKRKKRHLL